jgi:hypothetical protein
MLGSLRDKTNKLRCSLWLITLPERESLSA